MYEEDEDAFIAAWRKHRREISEGLALFLAVLLLLFGWEGPEPSAGNVDAAASSEQLECLEDDGTLSASAGKDFIPRQETAEINGAGGMTRSRSIRGAEKAAETEALENPFRLQHETRAEAERMADASRIARSAPSVLPQAAVPDVSESRMPPETESERDPPSAAADEKICLQGIVIGERGSIAILQKGSRAYSLSVGEQLDGKEIAVIGKQEVIFTDGEKLSLQLP